MHTCLERCRGSTVSWLSWLYFLLFDFFIVFLIIFLFYVRTHIVMLLFTVFWSTTHSTSNAQTALGVQVLQDVVCASKALNVLVRASSFCSEIYGYGHVCVLWMLPREDGTSKCIAECFVYRSIPSSACYCSAIFYCVLT